MDEDDFVTPGVLALLIPLKAHVGLISLCDRFDFSLSTRSEERSPTESVLLRISRTAPPPATEVRSTVGSLTVLYGENGWGKTHLMLEACRSLSNVKGERQIAVIWENGGRLYLDPGSVLRKRIAVEFPGGEMTVRSIEAPFGSIFYTTSPFETSKRRWLKSGTVHDVTPSFSPHNPFEGSSLLRAYAKLPSDLSFIEAAEVRTQVRLPSLRSLLEKITTNLKSKSDRSYLQDRQRRALAKLDQVLNELAKRILVVGLTIALQDSTEKAAEMMLRLADRLRIFDDSNGSALLDDEAKNRSSEAVVDFMHEPFDYRATGYFHPLVLHDFLDRELPSYLHGIGRKAKLGQLAKELGDFTERQWDMLRQATRLGLVTWSFRNLSSGQVALLMLFSSLSSAMSELSPQETSFLLIDEGEMFMHPSWQRRYITDLLKFLEKFPDVSSRLHVILSTHSLIVAADAPPKRLFDVKLGQMTNGFGYGPKDFLDQVYGVDEFQGEHAGQLMDTLLNHIRDSSKNALGLHAALALASSIADDRLRSYLINELRRRGSTGGRRID